MSPNNPNLLKVFIGSSWPFAFLSPLPVSGTQQHEPMPLQPSPFRQWPCTREQKSPTCRHQSGVPVGSPSRSGDVKVCVLDINQPSLPTPFTLFLCLFLSYGPFTCISFHKFSRQFSVFSLFSLSYFCLIGPFNYISLSNSLPKWFQRPSAFAVHCNLCQGS